MIKKNFNELDGLKTIIMFCVILFHSFMPYIYTVTENPLWPLVDKDQSAFINPLVLLLVTFGMPLCIFLSGFLLYILFTKKGANGFIKNRLSKMLLPVLIAIPLLSVFFQQFFPATENTITIKNVSLYTYHLWFAYYLIMVMVFVYIASLTGKIHKVGNLFIKAIEAIEKLVVFGLKYKFSWLIFPLISILLPGSLEDGAIKISYSVIPSLPIFSSYLFLFYVGWVLNKNRYLLKAQVKNVYTTLSIGVAAYVALILIARGIIDLKDFSLLTGISAMSVFTIVSYFVMWGFTVGLFALSLRLLGRKGSLLEYLANASFAIYIIHFPVCVFIINAIASYDIPAIIKGVLVFSLTSIASFAIYDLIRRLQLIVKK